MDTKCHWLKIVWCQKKGLNVASTLKSTRCKLDPKLNFMSQIKVVTKLCRRAVIFVYAHIQPYLSDSDNHAHFHNGNPFSKFCQPSLMVASSNICETTPVPIYQIQPTNCQICKKVPSTPQCPHRPNLLVYQTKNLLIASQEGCLLVAPMWFNEPGMT